MKRTQKKVCVYACSCINAHCTCIKMLFALQESKASSVKKCVCVCVCLRGGAQLEITFISKLIRKVVKGKFKKKVFSSSQKPIVTYEDVGVGQG